jgi:hypothetical protein
VGDMNLRVPNIVVSAAKRVGWTAFVLLAAVDYGIVNSSKPPQIDNRNINPIELLGRLLKPRTL